MTKNIIRDNDLKKIINEIEKEANSILDDINKVYELINELPMSFNTIDSIKIYDVIKNNRIVVLKKECMKILTMKVILEKISNAYNMVEIDFFTKRIIEK